MSRKEINIGIEGNDGTGDSIRDSFQKVNTNFTELYAILGQGGKLSFIGLDDVERERPIKEYRTADNNKILVVDSEGEQLVFKELVGSETIIVNQSFPGQIRLSSLASALINDPDPTLQTNLNANFKRLTNLSEATEDTDAATKEYVDSKLSLDGTDTQDISGNARPDRGVMRGPLILSRNPVEEDDLEYNGLVAATKAYVDSKTFNSQFNIYVSPNGRDERTDLPQNQIGRSEATAFGSVQKACEKAEELVDNAPLELGPYLKVLTYANGTKFCQVVSVEESELSGSGCVAAARMGIDDTGSIIQILIAGTGYQKDDVLTPIGGTFLGQETQLRVIAVDFAGSILQLAINEDLDGVKQNGIYSILPADHINNDYILLAGGSGSGTARVRVRWKVTQVDVLDTGEGYTSASVIFSGGSGSGAEAFITEIGGEVKEITVAKAGSGYTDVPAVAVFLPRMLVSTERLNTDFLDDIREGQALRGETSGALARIIQHDGSLNGDGDEIFEIEIINGVFQIGERLKYADLTKNIQITIHVETGIYFENYPLRLAENVTLRGDDMRRTIIRPKPGVSESPWVRVFFRRDPVVDGLRVTDFEYGYQYLTDPSDASSQPKNNDEMDVLLCNDATRISELSFQGHGGFSMVLDPSGQILSKSPYFQTGSSFSKSINEKTFAGGMYIDGFSGNLEGVLLRNVAVDPSDPAYIPSDPLTHREYEKVIIGGLLRQPNLPTSFDINKELYRITLINRVETDLFDAKILLERNRRFIQTETVSFVLGEYPTLDFDQDVLFQNVGLIVDAVIDDTIFGGFLNSTEAARLYHVSGATTGISTEITAAMLKAKEVAVAVITQDPNYGRVGTVDQVLLPAYPNGGDAQTVVEDAFDLVANIIEYGESIYKAKTLLQENKEIIQAETIAYLDAIYPELNYNRETCYRDVGYIVDAWSIDIFGDFNNSLRAGYSYYTQGSRIIPEDGPLSQLSETIDGIQYAALLAIKIVKNELLGGLVRTTKTFNPTSNIDLTANTITILDHGFKSGSRVKYSSGGGNSIVVDNLDDENGDPVDDLNDLVFFVYVVDGDNIQLVENLSLLIAKEKGVSTSIELNIVGTGSGTTHTLAYFQVTDPELVVIDITDAGVDAAISNGTFFITTLIAGDSSGPTVPDIYPRYECVLDSPYYADEVGQENIVGKVVLSTAGNKSMLGNDFTQVNDMGYGIFVNNNGLSEQVGVFTYYCHTAFYSLNGAQIRSIGGSSAHGVFGLKAEGADPNEIPDSILLKFPMIQIAEAFENVVLELENDRLGEAIYVTNYSYLPRAGCLVDIDHTDDRTDTINPAASVVVGIRYQIATLGTTDWNDIAGTSGVVYAVGDKFTTVNAGSGDGTVYTLTTIGQRSYVAETVSISGMPDGVAKLQLSTVSANAGLAVYVAPGKSVVIRSNEEFVLADKEEVVAVRPSTALIFAENPGTAIRLLSFNQYDDVDAGPDDQIITTRDGYQYVKLTILKDTDAFDVPTGFGELGDDRVIVQALNFRDSKRVVFPITGATIYDGSTSGTGGMIFGYQDSMYEITDYQVNNLDPNNIFGIISFKNITNSLAEVARSYTFSVTGASPAQISTTTDHNLSDGRRVKINGSAFYVKNVISNVTHGPLGGTNVFPVAGGGSSATFTITRTNSISYAGIAINAAGTGYAIGDTITILGASLGGVTPENNILITVNEIGGSGDIVEAVISRGIAKQVRMQLQLYSNEALTAGVNSSELGSDTTAIVLGGLTFSPLEANGTNVSFDAGIRAGAVGTVTVNISTMRATGHDFLDIGTGSYADTNYPSNIFGEPANEPDVEAQVVEVTTGRVFYVSTDQNGNFKVGDFFAVDQGTGKLTLDAKIDLKGIDSLKLRSGNEIFEFTNDITMGGEGAADPQATPTEYAVRSYIDKRLGLNHFGVRVTDGLRGPGFLALDGSLAVKGTIEMDGNTLRNLPAPRKGAVGDTEAVPKFYMQLGNLEDGPDYWRPAEGLPNFAIQRADILAFTGTGSDFSHATVTGALTFTLNTATANDPFIVSTINDNVIVNDDVNYDAGILQHKLNLNYIRATAADGFVITAYTTTGAPSGFTRFTANGHGISENDSIEIAGETTIALTGINKRWQARNVTANTFDVPITGLTGVLSGNAKVREPGILSGARLTEFEVSTTGFIQLRASTSTSTGVTFDKLAFVDPAIYDATDETTYAGGGTKLLGRRALPSSGSVIGQPVPIDARTVVRDGFGISKFDVPLEGVLARIDLANDPTDVSFTSIGYGSANSGNDLVRRDASGNFAANEITVNSIISNGNLTFITAAGDVSNPNGIRMSINNTTATILQRAIEAGSDNAYKTVLRNGNGGNGIVIVDGNSDVNKHTDYYANEHRFYDASGGSGTVFIGNGILKAAGGSGASVQGRFTLEAGASFQATWADLAEWYSSDKEYAPGTVLEFGGDAEVRASTKPGTTRVAGVVTTNPAYVMNQGLEGTRTCVALQGRVPCKVVGKVEKGDLMITSSVLGVAVSAGEVANPGTIIGKALQSYNSDHIGTIEVAVGRL